MFKEIIDMCPDCGSDLQGKNGNYCEECKISWEFKKRTTKEYKR